MTPASDGGGADAGLPRDRADREADFGAGGTEAEVRQLYDRYADPLLRFLLRLTLGERPLAEDLLQETLLRAWRNLANLPAEPENRRKWLFTVARRVAIDAARARKARPAETVVTDFNRLQADGDEMETVVAVHTIREALSKLSPEHRAVLIELYYRGGSMAETAARLGIPGGTVKSRAHYALRALRVAVESTDGD
jgi:RNA polymerase sigma-70 factor (ECF subfamily)